jgi:hypothetical protein
MNTIYLLSGSPYLDDALQGFATSEIEIKQIAINHFRSFLYGEPITVEVDMDKRLVTVTEAEEEGGYVTRYHIHAIERAVNAPQVPNLDMSDITTDPCKDPCVNCTIDLPCDLCEHGGPSS